MNWRQLLTLFLLPVLISPGFTLDREKLMRLDPPPSIRVRQVSADAEKNKLVLTAGYGLSGGWIIFNNLNKGYDAYRINNILAGSTLLVTAALNYWTPSSYRSDQQLLDELNLDDKSRETTAYFLIKSNAKSAQIQRRATALMYLLSGLGSAVLAGNSTNLSSDERFWTNLNAAGFLALAAYTIFVPSEDELAARELDRDLAFTR